MLASRYLLIASRADRISHGGPTLEVCMSMGTRSLARSLGRAAVTALALSAVFAVSAGAQVNGARLAIGPTMPTSTTVGAKGVPVFVSLTNLSEPTDGKLIIPPDSITLTPSCGSLPGGAVPPCPNPDPGVFAVGATGTGRAGTNCAGLTYAISQTSVATGELGHGGPALARHTS